MNSVSEWWLGIGAVATLALYERVGFVKIGKTFRKDWFFAMIVLSYFVTAWPYWIVEYVFGGEKEENEDKES